MRLAGWVQDLTSIKPLFSPDWIKLLCLFLTQPPPDDGSNRGTISEAGCSQAWAMVGGWEARKLCTCTTLSGKQRWIWKMPLACRVFSLSDWPSPVGKVGHTSLKQCGNGITWTYMENLIDGAQQSNLSYSHREGWKKKSSHRAPSFNMNQGLDEGQALQYILVVGGSCTVCPAL